MQLTILIICRHCQAHNKHHYPDSLERKIEVFESFSEAWEHKAGNLDHIMDFELRDISQDED